VQTGAYIMSNTHINPQDLLEQILATGQELAKRGTHQTRELTAKGKDIAAKGEDYLVDKLDLEDTEAARAALRKGVGTGAAAGALALLLSSRSGRKMITLGGLAGLGAIAYKAHKAGKMPTSAEDVIGLLTGPKAEARSDVLLKAMIAAAKADGDIHEDELNLIRAHDDGAVDTLKMAFNQAPDPKEIARLADNDQVAAEIYAVSCRVANGLNPKERSYLDELAMGLRLDPEIAARIETDVRTG